MPRARFAGHCSRNWCTNLDLRPDSRFARTAMARAGRKHECASTSNSKPITRKRETSMSSKTKRNESIGPKQPPPRRGGRKMLWRGTRRVRREPNFAHTKSILNAANNRAANWTIGSKRNANSKAGRCRARRRARKAIRDVRGKVQSKRRFNRLDSLNCDRHVKQMLAENSRVLASVRRILFGGGLENRASVGRQQIGRQSSWEPVIIGVAARLPSRWTQMRERSAGHLGRCSVRTEGLSAGVEDWVTVRGINHPRWYVGRRLRIDG